MEEQKIRDDQHYRECVERLVTDVEKIKKKANSNYKMNIAILLLLFGYLVTFIFTFNYNVASRKELAETKANKQALNHCANWLKLKELDTANHFNKSRIDLYFELVHQPPEVTRGAVEKTSCIKVWNKPPIIYANNTQ